MCPFHALRDAPMPADAAPRRVLAPAWMITTSTHSARRALLCAISFFVFVEDELPTKKKEMAHNRDDFFFSVLPRAAL